jgi:two-component system, NtrC family, nitrogen regulation sensor histidine kinase NtrY
LKEAYLVDGTGALKTRGERSYLFDFEPLTEEHLTLAREGNTVLIPDWSNNEFRALIFLDAYADRYLYVTRTGGRLDPDAPRRNAGNRPALQPA